jgi:hypothetical protein
MRSVSKRLFVGHIERLAGRAAYAAPLNEPSPSPFNAVFVYRRAVGDGRASNPLGEAVPHPGATPASAFG